MYVLFIIKLLFKMICLPDDLYSNIAYHLDLIELKPSHIANKSVNENPS